MGSNTLKKVGANQTATDDDLNQFWQAFLGNFLPRNEVGIPTAFAGHLGSQAIPWQTVYANRIVATNLAARSGAALPANPQIGDQFLLTGSPPTLHVCLMAGVWSQITTA